MVRPLLVLPTFNEIDNLEPFIVEVRKSVPDLKILIIDDDSPDGTGLLADSLAERSEDIRVVHRRHEKGLGSAYRNGFRLVHGEPVDVVVTMDADFSHDPAAIPDLINLVEQGADVAIGSRYCPGGGVVNWPWHRRALSRWANRFTRLMLDLPVGDCTSGFRAYSIAALDAIETENVPGDGYVFLSQIVDRASRAGLRIVEHPITFKDREHGNSKMSWRVIVESMLLVSILGLRRKTSKTLGRLTTHHE